VNGAPRRLGLFGGTFDPPHIGHLVAAERFLTSLGLDQVWWLPCGTPALKGPATAPAELRGAMVAAAISGRPEFARCDLELHRPGRSYTVETLDQLHAAEPQAEWWLLLGLDALAELPRWRDPRRIVELARPAVVQRPGSDLEAVLATLPAWLTERLARAPMPPLDIASRQLRADVAAGRSIRYLVPAAVVELIEKHRLYRDA